MNRAAVSVSFEERGGIMYVRRWAIALLAAGTAVSGIPAAEATSAQPGFGFFVCNATINLAAGSGSTSCIGGTVGGFVQRGSTAPRAGAFDFSAAVEYDETACPLIGQATGVVYADIDGWLRFADVTYVRVGTVAVAVLTGDHSGAGTAVFTVAAGDIGPSLCNDTNVDITLTGVFAAV